MLRNKFVYLMVFIAITSLVLAACQPQTIVQTVVVTEEVIVEGTPQVVERVVTPTAAPVPEEAKVMVVCMAQEPTTLYTLDGSALVKTAVLEAVYEAPYDANTFDYQPVWLEKLPNLDDGDAVLDEVEVTVGDTVMDAVTEEVVTITPTSTVSLHQLDGSVIENDFAITPTASTIRFTITWTLVEGMTYEDGEPVTTDDWLFTWELMSSPDSPNPKFTVERTESVTAVDDRSWTAVYIPGWKSGTYFIDHFSGPYHPLPRHLYGDVAPAEMLQYEPVVRDPMGFGPFMIDEWVSGSHIQLSKSPTYWRAGEGLPLLDQLIYRFVPDTNQLLAQLASGECDLGTQDAAFEGSYALIQQFESEGLLVPQNVAGTVYEHLDFNIKPVDSYTGFAGSVANDDGTPIFANQEVRQAIAHCIDKQAISDQTTGGSAVVQHIYVPDIHPLYAGDDAITILEFNPERGLELLANNGWTDSDGDGVLDKGGQKLAFVHSTRTNPLRERVTQIVQAQLIDNCMIETTIELYGGEYFNDGPDGITFGRQYDLGEFAWLTGVEPPCNLYMANQIPSDEFGWGAQNNTGWENSEYDQACAAAAASLDEEVKASEHARAQALFSEAVPSIPLFARAKILVTRPEVTGVIMDPTNNSEMFNVENFDFTTP